MNEPQVTLRILGSGTSHGVPQMRCSCRVCTSTDPRDKRSRASALVSAYGTNLLIDCGPDFRTQMLACGSPRIDGVLITHTHYDHTGGLDDLRIFCPREGTLKVYASAADAAELERRLPYCFGHTTYPGVPRLESVVVEPGRPFMAGTVEVLPLSVNHGRLPVTAYRIGPLGYVTDCKMMPESTLERLKGCRTIVVNALRTEPHMSHMNLSEALGVINEVKPRMALLTHMSHEMPLHAELMQCLPPQVAPASDGMVVEC